LRVKLLKFLWGALLDLLFPQFCRLCGSYLFGEHYFVACKSCWEEHFRPYTGKKCKKCGHPLSLLPGYGELCGRCLESLREFYFDRVEFYTLYEALPEAAIRELKFSRVKPVAGAIAGRIYRHFNSFVASFKPHLVVPVPIHRSTLKERGFDQVQELLKALKTPFEPILEKPFKSRRQSSVGFEERLENVKGAFSLREGVSLKGKRVLLFDDVFTTGATASELSRLLKEAGAVEVAVYTVAYTPLKRRQATFLPPSSKGSME